MVHGKACGARSNLNPFASEDGSVGFRRVRGLVRSHWGHMDDGEA